VSVHSYGKGTEDQPNIQALVQAQDPEGRGELLRLLGYAKEAEHERRSLKAAASYPLLDTELYRRYFSRTLERTSDEHRHVLLQALAEFATANDKHIFDRFAIWAAPAGDRCLIVGIVETTEGGKTKSDQFLIAQVSTNGDAAVVTVGDMRKHFAAIDRAEARHELAARATDSLLDFTHKYWRPLVGAGMIACGSIFVLWLGFWPLAIVLGLGGVVLAVDSIVVGAEMKSDRLGITTGFVSFALMVIYGLAHTHEPPHVVSQKTILVCGVVPSGTSSAPGVSPDYNFAALKTPQGLFDVVSGKYLVTTGTNADGSFQTATVFEPTSDKAAATFRTGHTYQVTTDNHAGNYYAGITTATEVPNTLGQCG
jgi:hypothetical protein